MRNEGARILNRLELVYYRFVRFTSSRILDEQKHKNGKALFSTRGEIRLCSQGTMRTFKWLHKVLLYTDVISL
jgi:hypothetical protein